MDMKRAICQDRIIWTMQKKYSVLTNAVGMEVVKICEICEKTIAGKV